jgi:Ca2+-binding EF-hand superfamily protein
MFTTTDLELMKEVRDRQHQIFQMLHHIFKAADVNNDNSLSIHEFKEILRTDPNVKSTLAELSIMPSEIDWLFETLDADGSGNLSIDEFVEGVLKCKESELSRQLMQIQYTLIREVRFMAKTIMGDSYKVITNPDTGTLDAVPLASARPEAELDTEVDKPPTPSFRSPLRRSVSFVELQRSPSRKMNLSGLPSLSSVRKEVLQMEKEEHDQTTTIMNAFDILRSEMREEMRTGLASVQKDVEDIRKNLLATSSVQAPSDEADEEIQEVEKISGHDNSVEEVHEESVALRSPEEPSSR